MDTSTAKRPSVPIYEALADRIRQSVRDGQFAAGQLIGSEYELARQEKISRMTVRRASELLVEEGLLERRPGKGLYVRGHGVTTRTVQMIVGNLQWESSAQVSRGAQRVARERGIQMQIYDAHGDSASDVAILRQLPETQSRGAVIVALHNAAFNEAVYHLKSQDYPFVLVDQRLQDIEVPSVRSDNYNGGYQAGEALTKLGHREVAFIGDMDATTVRARLEGFRDAIADAGIPFKRSLQVDLNIAEQDRLAEWSDRVDSAVQDLVNRSDPPTAIFCSCDAVARAAYRTMQRSGLRVPEDISIIGFDDDPIAEWLSPGLTTIRQSFSDLGRVAMEMLWKRMENPHAVIEHQVLPVVLIQRGSVAPPRGKQ
jgi:DNA-binding LacI/PurR family transcriptional regulator